ncbi:hypothetical protein LCGC14_2156420 [marine sediment metagenome]|uniref:Uncharacterized protein n=1 Tax=marine sediment metagenome TaxID=412755 RepID=A0A0F9DU07_9ZZZZ
MGWPDEIWNDKSLSCDQTKECAEKYIKDFLLDMEGLYALETNFNISCFWDGGFDVSIGDGFNGYIWKDSADTLYEAIILLKNKIKEIIKKK